MTYRDLLNRVLIALGEDEIDSGESSLMSKYHKLLGLFVNQMKEMVEDAHNWRALRTTLSVTVTTGSTSAVLTNANERSRLVRVYDDIRGCEVPLVFDVTDASAPYRLKEMDLSELIRRESLYTGNNEDPSHFAIDNTGVNAMSIKVFPAPKDERTLQVTMVVPQAYLAVGDLDTNIQVPARPIEIGAIWYALEERGEELGPNSMFSEKLYVEALQTAIARDDAEQGGLQLVPS